MDTHKQSFSEIISSTSDLAREAKKDYMKEVGVSKILDDARLFDAQDVKELIHEFVSDKRFVVLATYRLESYDAQSQDLCRKLRQDFRQLLLIDYFTSADSLLFAASFGASALVFPAFASAGMNPHDIVSYARKLGVLAIPLLNNLDDLKYVHHYLEPLSVVALSKASKLSPQDVLESNLIPFALGEFRSKEELLSLSKQGFYGASFLVETQKDQTEKLPCLYKQSSPTIGILGIKSPQDLEELSDKSHLRAIIDEPYLQAFDTLSTDAQAIAVSARVSSLSELEHFIIHPYKLQIDSLELNVGFDELDRAAQILESLNIPLIYEFADDSSYDLEELSKKIRRLQDYFGPQLLSIKLSEAYAMRLIPELEKRFDTRDFLSSLNLILNLDALEYDESLKTVLAPDGIELSWERWT
ncbi:MAG: hypothetical protein Q4E22_06340 [Coriobacteriia bacterium]|nr:hypothetical protein [Coriobacteriia bacterium]